MINHLHLKFLILFFFLFLSPSFSQNMENDSVLVGMTGTLVDSDKVVLLNKKGLELKNTDPQNALLYFDKALLISEKIGYNNGIAKGFYYKGLIYKNTGNYKTAEDLYNKALLAYSVIENKKGMGQCYNGLGQVHMYQGEYEQALLYYQKSLFLAKSINDNKDVASVLNNIGLTYMNKANYETSLSYYLNSIKYYELASDTLGSAACHNNIGAIYYYLGKYSKALEHYKQSYAIQKKAGNKKAEAETLNNVGAAYYSMKDYTKSAEYYKMALDISREISDKKGVAASLSNLGLIYEKQEEYPAALKNYLEALLIYEQLDDKRGEATNKLYIGTAYYKQKELSKAIKYLQESIAMADTLKVYDVLKEAYRNLSNAYDTIGDISNAYKNYKLYTAIKDSVLNIETSKKLTEVQAKYETEKKEKENQLLEKETQLNELELTKKQDQLFGQRLLFVGIVLVILFLFLIIYILYRNKTIKKRNKLQTELNLYMQKALSQQMNPHFIFNTVNSIQYYILNNDKVASNKYLTMFARLMRVTLENSQHHLIPIRDEVQALNLYMELESLRFEGKFEYKLTLDEENEVETYKIPTLLIQPYVENSIWHGLMHKEGIGKILIDISVNGNMVKCTIEDNGIGRAKAEEIKKKKNTSHNSLGTKITENRLRLINSLYGSDMSVNFIDLMDESENANGTRVEICFPILE